MEFATSADMRAFNGRRIQVTATVIRTKLSARPHTRVVNKIHRDIQRFGSDSEIIFSILFQTEFDIRTQNGQKGKSGKGSEG